MDKRYLLCDATAMQLSVYMICQTMPVNFYLFPKCFSIYWSTTKCGFTDVSIYRENVSVLVEILSKSTNDVESNK